MIEDRVLLVDDEEDFVRALAKRLRARGLEVETAGTGEEALEQLPSCDVAVITSTALVLGDMDSLLEAAAGCREIALVGASTPLVAPVFAAHGVTLLSGVTVRDPERILQIVSEGGGMGLFGKAVRKVNIRC